MFTCATIDFTFAKSAGLTDSWLCPRKVFWLQCVSQDVPHVNSLANADKHSFIRETTGCARSCSTDYVIYQFHGEATFGMLGN